MSEATAADRVSQRRESRSANARLLVVLCTFGTRGMAFDTIV